MRTTAIILMSALMITAFIAQYNYECAQWAAVNSEGSDIAIESAMSAYGFNVEVMGPEPTMDEKIAALFRHNGPEYTMELMFPNLIRLTDHRDGSEVIVTIDQLEETINKREE